MARNVMSLESVKNKAHRSAFDLSGKRAFTAKVGEILPCYVREVLPGDKFDIDVAHFTRTSPVNTAAYCRIKENVDFFFVPMRLLWDKFPQWIVETDNPMFASSLYSGASHFDTCPYTTVGDFLTAFYNVGSNSKTLYGLLDRERMVKLAELLGYGSILRAYESSASAVKDNLKNSSQSINLWRFCAYQKACQDYYRLNQWENSHPERYNFDYVLQNSDTYIDLTGAAFSAPAGFFGLRNCNYPKDYLMGLLPRAQFGDTSVAGPVLGNLQVQLPPLPESSSLKVLASPTATSPIGNSSSSATINRVFTLSNKTGIGINNVNTSGISVLAIRQAQVLQKYREIIMSGNYDYRTQMEKHWNVQTSKAQSNMCFRLGGYSSGVEINEVVNTNVGVDSADIKGKGVSRGSSHISFDNKNFDNEYGIVIGLYSSYPLLDYDCNSGLPRELTLLTSEDYPKPEFDSIGMETTSYFEYALEFESGNTPSFIRPSVGYAPRYASWKTERDFVFGGFSRSSAYSNWVSKVDFNYLKKNVFFYSLAGGTPLLKSDAFKVNPVLLNSIFLAQIDPNAPLPSYDNLFGDDQLLINMMVSNRSVRNLSEDGLPY